MVKTNYLNKENLLYELKGRSALWLYVSDVFINIPNISIIPSTEELIPTLEAFQEELENSMLKSSIDRLKEFIKVTKDMSSKELSEKLNTDYTSLFLIGRDCVPSTESIWLSPSGLSFQEPWEAVVTYYDAWGFAKPDTCLEPEDHIGVELLFLASMMNTAAHLVNIANESNGTYDIDNILNGHSRFIEEHISKWSKQFAAGIMKTQTDLSIYQAAALLMQFLVEEM